MAQNSSILDSSERPKLLLYECALCKARFSKKLKLSVHINVHEGRKPYSCDALGCDKKYYRQQHLKAHRKRCHDKDLYLVKNICPDPSCTLVFKNLYNVRKHYHRFHNISCKKCHRKFQKKIDLKIHDYEVHEGVGAFKCVKCNIDFPSKGMLNRHNRTHTSYTCAFSECKLQFVRFVDLVTHEKIVHGEKFRCAMCSKYFNTKCNLKQHLQIHSLPHDRNIFKCSYEDCARYYYHEKNLKHHVKNYHIGINHLCDLCGCQLSTKQKLNNHLMLCGEEKLKTKKNSTKVRKRRVDSGKPKRTLAVKLSGFTLSYSEEKKLLQSDTVFNSDSAHNLKVDDTKINVLEPLLNQELFHNNLSDITIDSECYKTAELDVWYVEAEDHINVTEKDVNQRTSTDMVVDECSETGVDAEVSINQHTHTDLCVMQGVNEILGADMEVDVNQCRDIDVNVGLGGNQFNHNTDTESSLDLCHGSDMNVESSVNQCTVIDVNVGLGANQFNHNTDTESSLDLCHGSDMNVESSVNQCPGIDVNVGLGENQFNHNTDTESSLDLCHGSDMNVESSVNQCPVIDVNVGLGENQFNHNMDTESSLDLCHGSDMNVESSVNQCPGIDVNVGLGENQFNHNTDTESSLDLCHGRDMNVESLGNQCNGIDVNVELGAQFNHNKTDTESSLDLCHGRDMNVESPVNQCNGINVNVRLGANHNDIDVGLDENQCIDSGAIRTANNKQDRSKVCATKPVSVTVNQIISSRDIQVYFEKLRSRIQDDDDEIPVLFRKIVLYIRTLYKHDRDKLCQYQCSSLCLQSDSVPNTKVTEKHLRLIQDIQLKVLKYLKALDETLQDKACASVHDVEMLSDEIFAKLNHGKQIQPSLSSKSNEFQQSEKEDCTCCSSECFSSVLKSRGKQSCPDEIFTITNAHNTVSAVDILHSSSDSQKNNPVAECKVSVVSNDLCNANVLMENGKSIDALDDVVANHHTDMDAESSLDLCHSHEMDVEPPVNQCHAIINVNKFTHTDIDVRVGENQCIDSRAITTANNKNSKPSRSKICATKPVSFTANQIISSREIQVHFEKLRSRIQDDDDEIPVLFKKIVLYIRTLYKHHRDKLYPDQCSSLYMQSDSVPNTKVTEKHLRLIRDIQLKVLKYLQALDETLQDKAHVSVHDVEMLSDEIFSKLSHEQQIQLS